MWFHVKLYLGSESLHAVLKVAHCLEDACRDGGEDHVNTGLCAEAQSHLQQSVCKAEETKAYLPPTFHTEQQPYLCLVATLAITNATQYINYNIY